MPLENALRISTDRSILRQIEDLDIEPDQRVRAAIEYLPKVKNVGDHHLLVGLLRLNSAATSLIDIESLSRAAQLILSAREPATEPTPSRALAGILEAAIHHRREPTTLGTFDLLESWRRSARRPPN